MNNSEQANSRRQFLGKVGGITVATVGANVVGLSALSVLTGPSAQAAEVARDAGKSNHPADEEFQNELFRQIGRMQVELYRKKKLID